MDETRIVTENDLRQALTLDLDLVERVERSLAALSDGAVAMPPSLTLPFADGQGALAVKSARLPESDPIAVSLLAGRHDRAGRLIRHGLVAQISQATGAIETLFLDNGYLSALGTAAAGAVAARHLAPDEVTTAGVIGAGRQASLQIQAARLVRPFERVLVYGRNPRNAAACAAELGATLDVEVEITTDPEVLLRRSQLVVTTTAAETPMVRAAWMHKELHITAVGADQPHKNEIEPAGLARADLYVCDRVSQCATAGELRAARAAGVLAAETPPELGDIITGTHPGRGSPADITICDLTGTGAQDTALAALASARLGHSAPTPQL